MNIRIEIVEDIADDEVIIRCKQITGQIQKVQQLISEAATEMPKITFYKENEAYYFPLNNILFFETDNGIVYAHTRNDIYRIKMKLYELEDILPHSFIRISKSTIVNIKHIMMVNRNLASSNLIEFFKSHKQVYVSRRYYKALSQRLNERSSI